MMQDLTEKALAVWLKNQGSVPFFTPEQVPEI